MANYGRIWDGQGEIPSWLKRAVNAGESVELFPDWIVPADYSDLLRCGLCLCDS